MKKTIRAIGAAAVVALWGVLTLVLWFGPNKDISSAERRPLQQMPEITAGSIFGGSFMDKFEDFTLDQFPMRDSFRTLKSLFSYNVLQQKDNNGIYIADGYAAKLEYPLNETSVSYALKKLRFIYEQYLMESGSNIYMTVIPDKGYYLARDNGYLSMDYEKMFERVADGMPWAQMVDVTADLTIADYYRTDTHWRQEKLLGVSQTLCRALGIAELKEEDFTAKLTGQPFYGVYYGQAALPMEAEDLFVMENALLQECRVYNHETKSYQTVYDWDKLTGTDPYDVYLSGAQALLTIENPNADTDRELIIFRDSFGSSLAPLLVHGYKTVTLVDIRYVSSALLEQYLEFNGQDVLFAYSTLILNSSSSLK